MENLSIIQKIKSLLEKTEANGATKAEAEAALQKASELMLKHFIEEHQLNEEQKQKEFKMETVQQIPFGYKTKSFLYYLAQLFNCEVYWNDKKQYIKFFGFKEDSEIAGYFYSVIMNSLIKETALFKNSNDFFHATMNGTHGREVVSSFVQGYIKGISKKLNLLYHERIENTPEQFALTVINDRKKVQIAFENLNLKIRSVKTTGTANNKSAFETGVEQGEKISINKGIGNQKQYSNTKLLS